MLQNKLHVFVSRFFVALVPLFRMLALASTDKYSFLFFLIHTVEV